MCPVNIEWCPELWRPTCLYIDIDRRWRCYVNFKLFGSFDVSGEYWMMSGALRTHISIYWYYVELIKKRRNITFFHHSKMSSIPTHQIASSFSQVVNKATGITMRAANVSWLRAGVKMENWRNKKSPKSTLLASNTQGLRTATKTKPAKKQNKKKSTCDDHGVLDAALMMIWFLELPVAVLTQNASKESRHSGGGGGQ